MFWVGGGLSQSGKCTFSGQLLPLLVGELFRLLSSDFSALTTSSTIVIMVDILDFLTFCLFLFHASCGIDKCSQHFHDGLFSYNQTNIHMFALRDTVEVGLMLMLWMLCFSHCESSELIPKSVAFITSSIAIISMTIPMLSMKLRI